MKFYDEKRGIIDIDENAIIDAYIDESLIYIITPDDHYIGNMGRYNMECLTFHLSKKNAS